ncbi:LOW QUALITY PROTEIN: hypothetical protein PHMEG_0009714 [Phytophthora megakarya]|uniref:PiggyBac transposable element-derived protein domain-containing protein n=1 Tax=Phytophthora megakarya TaxID=4795 RepID=A0A225WGW2_9STRA|nr:LOW QUALITY PROTEIN: hypothetical protein PHMEG_0009714 [Phytophthora megakarya]
MSDVEDDVEEADVDEYIQQPYEPVDNSSIYPWLRQRYSGPSAEALRHEDSPIGLFFYMMPVVLWQHIAASSNEYHRGMLPLRYEEAYRRYRKKYFASKRSRDQPELPRKTRRDIQNEMAAKKPIMPHELCRFVGLLVARTIAPNREKLANHWKTADVGAISRGCFDSVLSRDRFLEISRNLHFNSNKNPRAQTDRAWKIRKVVEVLQRTFARGYVAPSELSFDEAVLPSRSSFNKMRVYMKDKPHKWGTKLFILCSTVTAYCIRYVFGYVVYIRCIMLFIVTEACSSKLNINSFEVYCGKKQQHKTDMKSGPAEVVRNLLEVFGPEARKDGMRLIVIDRFYTSVALEIQLLLMGFYCVGTIMTNRLGYCKDVIEKKKTRPANISRGSFKLARWCLGGTPAQYTGGSLALDRVVRQDGTTHTEVPCPRVIEDYHTFMGGVDVHDQLRLQRYSLRRALRFRKYYKSLVLVLIDLAIVNGYIIHKAYHKNMESRPLTHVKYMIKLHLQLIQLQASDMYEWNAFGAQLPEPEPTYVPLPVGADESSEHAARQVDEWWNADTQAKRRQRSCKVCSVLRTEKHRAATTTYYCSTCSDAGPIYLCMRARRKVREVAMTCWDIWHKEWSNGKMIPVDNGRAIRVRRMPRPDTPRTPTTPGTPITSASNKRRRTSQ